MMRESATNTSVPGPSKKGKTFPRVIAMGGNHTITLPVLRSMNRAYGPITDTNIHAGIRTTLSGLSDQANDGYCGFQIVEARKIDTIGTAGIIKKIRDRVGTTNLVYLSIDIDTLNPAFAPATGTPETGGSSTREPRTIMRGLEGINLVAADIVEVAPAYDTNAELTTMAAADTLYEVMTLMVKNGPLSEMVKKDTIEAKELL
ncbi:hypothetical protein LTR22_025030 [Elasticomyces elasticus]|nr:hypothetical protein LTR22_025030 [Elasticomyces elasticus]